MACLLDREWLMPLAYRIDGSPLVFVGTGGVGLVASLAAARKQAWTVTRVSPADGLRQE